MKWITSIISSKLNVLLWNLGSWHSHGWHVIPIQTLSTPITALAHPNGSGSPSWTLSNQNTKYCPGMAQVSQILLCQNKFYRGWPQLATHSTQGTTTNALVPDTEGHPQDLSLVLASNRSEPSRSSVGPLWIWRVLAQPTDTQTDWDLRNFNAGLTPWAFCHISGRILSSFCDVAGSITLLGGPLLLGSAIAMKVVLVLDGRCISRCKHMNARAHGRIFHHNEMINVQCQLSF